MACVSRPRSTETGPLPSEKAVRRLQDIVENSRSILTYVTGMKVADFKEDRKTYDAVERCFERICEAAAKLGGSRSGTHAGTALA